MYAVVNLIGVYGKKEWPNRDEGYFWRVRLWYVDIWREM